MVRKFPGPKSFEGRWQKRADQKDLEKTLSAQGWRTTGDLPYAFGHSLGLQKKVVHMSSQIRGFLDDILKQHDAEYQSKNVRKMGLKTWVSAEVVAKIEESVKARFLDAG